MLKRFALGTDHKTMKFLATAALVVIATASGMLLLTEDAEPNVTTVQLELERPSTTKSCVGLLIESDFGHEVLTSNRCRNAIAAISPTGARFDFETAPRLPSSRVAVLTPTQPFDNLPLMARPEPVDRDLISGTEYLTLHGSGETIDTAQCTGNSHLIKCATELPDTPHGNPVLASDRTVGLVTRVSPNEISIDLFRTPRFIWNETDS